MLSRDQSSPDIVTEDLIETPLNHSSDELLAVVKQNNPQIQVDASSIRKQDAQVASAKQEGKPDFELGYVYQNTDRKYRDYYMFTFDVRLPRKARVDAEIAEATEKRSITTNTRRTSHQQQLAKFSKSMSKRQAMKGYTEGIPGRLIPQSDAAYRATLNAYASNREPFIHVLSYFTDLLCLRIVYAQTLVDHEAAVAHLETLTGKPAMNKYVLRTSLVWIAILASHCRGMEARTHAIKQPTAMKTPMSGEMQPVASGPPATADGPKPSMPDMKR